MDHERQTDLTPSQAADVIRYYNEGDNAAEHASKDKIPLARSAIRTTLSRHSILPEGKPMLGTPEMAAGLDCLDQQEERRRIYEQNLSTPPRTNADRDYAERASGTNLEE